MGSYHRHRSRSTAGIEPHIREWKTYKKERAGTRFKREREREREKEGKGYLRTTYQNFRMALFKYSSRIMTILSMLKSKFPPPP